jgi:hypothetical protein
MMRDKATYTSVHIRAVTALFVAAAFMLAAPIAGVLADTGPLWAGKYGYEPAYGRNVFNGYNGPQNIAIQRHDGGYAALSQYSPYRFITEERGPDFWVSGLDRDGAIEWQYNYGLSITNPSTGVVDLGHGEVPVSIKQTNDNGYIVLGTVWPSFSGNRDILLMKLDANGNVEWSRRYDSSAYYSNAVSVEQTQDGGYIVGAQMSGAAAILKISLDGDLEWSYSANAVRIAGAKEVEGGYVVGGQRMTSNAQLTLLKIGVTPAGPEILWERAWDAENYPYFNDRPYTLGVTSDGGYVLAGSINPPQYPYPYPASVDRWLLVAKFGWQDDTPNDADPSKLTVQWAGYYSEDIGAALAPHIARSVEQTQDGDIVVAGSVGGLSLPSGASGRAWVLKLAATDGSVLWSQYYNTGPANTSSSGQSITETAGGGLLTSGPNFGMMMIVHTNELGEIEDNNCSAVHEPPPAIERVELTYFDYAQRPTGNDLVNPYYEMAAVMDRQTPGVTGDQDCYYDPPSNYDPYLTVSPFPVVVDEGESASNTGGVGDTDGDLVALSASVGSVTTDDQATWYWSFDTTDGPNDSQTVTVTADDGNGGSAAVDFELVVNNVAPSVGPVMVPHAPVALGDQPVTVSAGFSDPAGAFDQHSCTIDYGDGTGPQPATVADSTCSGDYSFGEPGVYAVTVTVEDEDGGVGSRTAADFIVIYDPSGGFVTGGGWIDSPAGACQLSEACTGATGSAHFGFVSKYKKGTTVPIGQTEFQFQAGDLNFHSSSYEWLVVAGPKAMYKGTGTINGSGNYGFLLKAIDAALTPSAEVDRFRIKIWDKDAGDTVVYDNEMAAAETDDPTTEITRGQIVIHTAK